MRKLQGRRTEKSKNIGRIVWGMVLAIGYTLSTTAWGIIMIPVALLVLIALSPLIFLVAYLQKLLKHMSVKDQPQRNKQNPERPDTAYQPEPVYI